MKNEKTGRKATPVRVPSWDPAALNSDLLAGVADTSGSQGRGGWAYQEIGEFINASFPVGHNPLETLRKILPQWKWSISEIDHEVSPWEGEIGHPAYCSFCGYCGNGSGGGYGEDQAVCQWAYSHSSGRVFWAAATRPTSGLGFVAKTTSGRLHFVEYRTPIQVTPGNLNWQAYPPGSRWEKVLAGKETRFVSFDGLIPEGTRPVPVEQVGEDRPWEDIDDEGRLYRSGVETDYRLPDGSLKTHRVCTYEA